MTTKISIVNVNTYQNVQEAVVSATANTLGNLAEELKNILIEGNL